MCDDLVKVFNRDKITSHGQLKWRSGHQQLACVMAARYVWSFSAIQDFYRMPTMSTGLIRMDEKKHTGGKNTLPWIKDPNDENAFKFGYPNELGRDRDGKAVWKTLFKRGAA